MYTTPRVFFGYDGSDNRTQFISCSFAIIALSLAAFIFSSSSFFFLSLSLPLFLLSYMVVNASYIYIYTHSPGVLIESMKLNPTNCWLRRHHDVQLLFCSEEKGRIEQKKWYIK